MQRVSGVIIKKILSDDKLFQLVNQAGGNIYYISGGGMLLGNFVKNGLNQDEGIPGLPWPS